LKNDFFCGYKKATKGSSFYNQQKREFEKSLKGKLDWLLIKTAIRLNEQLFFLFFFSFLC
jgi:hypothetical protein